MASRRYTGPQSLGARLRTVRVTAEKHPLNLTRFAPAEGSTVTDTAPNNLRADGNPVGSTSRPTHRFTPPLHGARNPGRETNATTPGSFALAHDVGGPLMFASPDTPGMPAPSGKTAWDFLPEGWSVETGTGHRASGTGAEPQRHAYHSTSAQSPVPSAFASFTSARGEALRVAYPAGFTPITQLEHARLGIVTPQMARVAEREPHLTPEQVRDEVAAGRMVIPANTEHLKKCLFRRFEISALLEQRVRQDDARRKGVRIVANEFLKHSDCLAILLLSHEHAGADELSFGKEARNGFHGVCSGQSLFQSISLNEQARQSQPCWQKRRRFVDCGPPMGFRIGEAALLLAKHL